MPTDYIDGLDDLDRYFAGIDNQFNEIDYQPFGRLELLELADIHAGYFRDAAGPDNVAWPPLAPSTIRRKGHAKILIDTTRLRQSLTSKTPGGDAIRDVIEGHDVTHVVFGSAVEYGAYHDTPAGSRPARRHVGVNEQHLEHIANRMADYAINELAADN